MWLQLYSTILDFIPFILILTLFMYSSHQTIQGFVDMQTQCLSMVGCMWVEIPLHQVLSTCSHNVVNTTIMESPRIGHWETCPSFKRFTIELSRRSRCYAQAKVLQLKSKLWNISNILKFNGSCYFVFANVLEFFKCIMHHTKYLLCELIGLVNTLIKESMSYFPTTYLMDVVGLVYLQYWIQDNANHPSKLIKDHHSYN